MNPESIPNGKARNKKWRIASLTGFTLIELMITVAIVGILTVVATGSFLTFQAKSKQAEAKINLEAIASMAEAYKVEFDTYAVTISGLGWAPNSITRYRYWYNGTFAVGTPATIEASVDYTDPGSAADDVSFTAYAVGNIDYDVTRDIWSINENRDPRNPQNDPLTP